MTQVSLEAPAPLSRVKHSTTEPLCSLPQSDISVSSFNHQLWRSMDGRFTFEQIRNMKELIYFYERAENHKAKEWMLKSFKSANFLGKHQDAGVDQ